MRGACPRFDVGAPALARPKASALTHAHAGPFRAAALARLGVTAPNAHGISPARAVADPLLILGQGLLPFQTPRVRRTGELAQREDRSPHRSQRATGGRARLGRAVGVGGRRRGGRRASLCRLRRRLEMFGPRTSRGRGALDLGPGSSDGSFGFVDRPWHRLSMRGRRRGRWRGAAAGRETERREAEKSGKSEEPEEIELPRKSAHGPSFLQAEGLRNRGPGL